MEVGSSISECAKCGEKFSVKEKTWQESHRKAQKMLVEHYKTTHARVVQAPD